MMFARTVSVTTGALRAIRGMRAFGLLLCSAAAFAAVPAVGPARANPALEGYARYEPFVERLEKLAESDLVALRSLARTEGDREVWLLTLGPEDADNRPAILVLGSVDAAHLAGSELAVRMAERIVRTAEAEGLENSPLARHTLYIIPRPGPDASERNFQRPWREQRGNARGAADPLPPDPGGSRPQDLNGDGWITMMRIEQDGGEYIPHPLDPRVMIQADPAKNEVGRYRLLPEGLHDPEGEHLPEFHEPGSGGVDFNRNFTYRYPYFQPAAGPHAVSEPETRAVADFAFDRTNIAAVFCFSPHDNLMHPWKPHRPSENERIKTHVLSDDVPFKDFIAERYRQLHPEGDAPESSRGQGAFSEWAYFHYGRWSFAARGWWIPRQDEALPTRDEAPPENAEQTDGEEPETEAAEEEAERPAQESRGKEELNRLRWFTEQGIEGFVDWEEIEHPDFPDRKVEVGGFKPFYAITPPAERLDPLAEMHARFLEELAGRLPRIELTDPRVEPLGGGVHRVRVAVRNAGYLPTFPRMGVVSQNDYPPQLSIELPEGGLLVHGAPRTAAEPIAGQGGRFEHIWLVRLTKARSGTATIRVRAPSIGTDEIEVKLE